VAKAGCRADIAVEYLDVHFGSLNLATTSALDVGSVPAGVGAIWEKHLQPPCSSGENLDMVSAVLKRMISN